VRGRRIAAVGPLDEVMELAGPATEVVDLGGRLLLPGFIDAHCHLVAYGFSRLEADCRYPAVRSIRDIQDRIREKARTTPPGGWVRASGYDQSRLEEGRHPTRFDLDAACADKPVLLTRACGHIAVVNTRALELAGLGPASPDPPGGRLDRDERGHPNGVLRETAVQAVLALVAPKHEELVSAIRAGMRDFLALGITSVHEAGVDAAAFRALREVAGGPGSAAGTPEAGPAAGTPEAPRLRVYAMLEPSDRAFQETLLRSGLGTGFGDEWLRLGPLKLMVDGSSSGPTAATREPYACDRTDRGLLYLSQEELDERFAAAARAGFQLTAHAVGDRAVEMVVTAIERATAEDEAGRPRGARGAPGARHRIEHCAMTDPALRERIRRLGVVPVLQPVFLHEFGDGYLRNYGRERASGMFAAGSFLRAGVRFALSSDCPVTSPDPMLNVYEAVTRRTMGGEVLGPEEAVTVAGALRALTADAAYASFEEGLKGTVQPGKLADLVVLSGDPFRAGPEEIREMKAVLTMVGGRVVHRA